MIEVSSEGRVIRAQCPNCGTRTHCGGSPEFITGVAATHARHLEQCLPGSTRLIHHDTQPARTPPTHVYTSGCDCGHCTSMALQLGCITAANPDVLALPEQEA